jgi:hypothetical protein
MRGSDGVTVRGLPKRACAANCLHATASRSRQTSLNRKVLMRRRGPGPRSTLTKPSSFTCRKAKPQVPWIMPHCRSMSLKLIAATPPPCVTLLSIRARTRRPECGRNLSHAVTLTVNNQRPSASPRPRCPRLWPEITRPSRSSRFKHAASAAKLAASVPPLTNAIPHHSRVDDAQKGQNGNSDRVFGARLLRRLHGRTVTDGLFQEKVTAQ